MKTILIVDDEIYTRDHLGRILMKKGFQVLTATTGEEGIELFREHRPEIVFLDLLLPGIDGEHVFEYLQEIDPAVNVYFITGCEEMFSEEEARRRGARGFLRKPMGMDELVPLLDQLKD